MQSLMAMSFPERQPLVLVRCRDFQYKFMKNHDEMKLSSPDNAPEPQSH
jgi:hypothetical protein